MNPAELETLVEQITTEICSRLERGVRGVRDAKCSDCEGQCARRCAFKLDDFLNAGAARIGGAPGIGQPKDGIAALIDHTILKPEATESDIDRLCDEAAKFHFASVCINPVFVERCRRRLEGSQVLTCTVIGFPLGATLSSVKAEECRRVQDAGAQELDMVIPVGLLKSGRHDLVKADIAAVVAARRPGHLVKVIIETCLLTDEEKRVACRLAKEAGADYVKTSTGFSTGGATVSDIALMRDVVGPSLGVKASGGVKDLKTVQDMVKAGATRIGASAGVKIVQETPA